MEHFGLDDEAAWLRKAIDATIGAAILTKDVGGTATTDDVTATIIDQLDVLSRMFALPRQQFAAPVADNRKSMPRALRSGDVPPAVRKCDTAR